MPPNDYLALMSSPRDINVVLPEDQPVVLHTSLTTLPLHKFIDADVDGNLSALIISGIPEPELLTMTWIDLQQEYSHALGDMEQQVQTELFKEVAELGCNYRLVHLIVQSLRLAYSQVFVDSLNDILNRSLIFDYDNQKSYNKQLDLALKYSVEIKIRFKQKSEALNMMQGGPNPNAAEKKKPTYESYQGLLITLSDHAKYQITDRIMTFEFCERIKRLRNYQQSQKKQVKNG